MWDFNKCHILRVIWYAELTVIILGLSQNYDLNGK